MKYTIAYPLYIVLIGLVSLIILLDFEPVKAKTLDCFETTSETYRIIVDDPNTIVVKSQGDILTFEPSEGQKVSCPYNK